MQRIRSRSSVAIACCVGLALTFAATWAQAQDSQRWPFPQAAAGGVGVVNDKDNIGLYNAQVGVLIRKADAVVLGVWSKEDGSLVDNRKPLWSNQPLPMWTAEMKIADVEKPVSAPATAAQGGKWSVEGKGDQKTIVAEFQQKAGLTPGFSVTAKIALTADDAAPRWSVQAKPEDASVCLWSVTFPQLAVLGADTEAGQNRLLVPYRRGRLGTYAKDSVRADSEIPYPGPGAKFQFIAAYGGKTGKGFYLAAEDGRGGLKSFVQRNYPAQDAILLAIKHYPDNHGKPGATVETPYAVVTRPFKGDWWDAARIYRQWWQKQEWASQGLLINRSDVPDWLKKAAVMTRPSTSMAARTVANNLKNALALQEALGGRGFVGTWYSFQDPGRALAGLDQNGHGHVLPAQAGVKDAVAQLKAKDIHFMAYVQSVIYTGNFKPEEDPAAAKAVTRDLKGQIVYYGDASKHQLYNMCRATDYWQQRISEIGTYAVGDVGFDGIYLDSFGKGSAECFSPDHGHGIGGGDTITQGQRELAKRLRQTIRKLNPQAIMSGEAPNECYKDLLDVDLYAQNIWTGYVPIYRTVWGDYTMGHGRVIRHAKENGNLVAEMSSMFLEGTIIGRIFLDGQANFLLAPGAAQEMDHLRKLVAYTEAGLDYLRLGEYLKPLTLAVPETTFVDSVGDNPKYSTTVPVVMNSVLRSHRDGSVAVMLVNVGQEEQTVKVPVQLAWRGGKNASSQATLLRRDEKGQDQEIRQSDKDWEETVTIGPRDVVMLILR